MTIIRRRRDRTVTVVPDEVFADERIGLRALGLYCWLSDEGRTAEAAMERFGLLPHQLAGLLAELRAAGLVDAEDEAS